MDGPAAIHVAALQAEELRLTYGPTVAVKDASLQFPAGQVTTIVGPNGCGKSTVLQAMARLLKPDVGSIVLDGRAIRDFSARDLARRLALLPQGVQAPGELTVRDLVGFGRYPHQTLLGRPSAADRDAVAWALAATGLEGLATRPVGALSGGERQRAWVAMALAQRTGILLLDEPTTYLDVRHQVELLSLVRGLNQETGLTVGMVLHDLNQAMAFSDRIVLMRAGSVVAAGPPASVLTADRLQAVFDVEIRVVEAADGGPPAFVPAYRAPTRAPDHAAMDIPPRLEIAS